MIDGRSRANASDIKLVFNYLNFVFIVEKNPNRLELRYQVESFDFKLIKILFKVKFETEARIETQNVEWVLWNETLEDFDNMV